MRFTDDIFIWASNALCSLVAGQRFTFVQVPNIAY